METNNYFNELRERTLSFSLRDNYQNRSYTVDFNNHVNALFNCESELSENPDLLVSDNYKFSKVRYYEAESSILDALDDIDDEVLENDLSNLEDDLYIRIERELGVHYDRSPELGLIIDNTVHSSLLAVRYNFFNKKDQFINPWEFTANILRFDNYLYKAIFDENEFSEIKRLKRNSKKSEVLVDTDIYVAVKGRNESFTYGSFRDFVRLRRIMLSIIEDKVGSANTPIKFESLVEEINEMNAGLTESEIKSKLIYPLKAISKIGSCKEGYFILRTCEDIAKSYESHYNRLRGYLRTLDAHKSAAKRLESDCLFDFTKHLR